MASVESEAAGIKVRAPIIVAIIASIGTIIVAGMSAFFQGTSDSQSALKIEDSIKTKYQLLSPVTIHSFRKSSL